MQASEVTNEARRTRGVSAIIINYEGGESLLRCVQSLQHRPQILETIIVDNSSKDGSAAAVSKSFPDLNIVWPATNLGFARGANAGAQVADGDLLLFLNPDIEMTGSAVSALVTMFDDPTTGVAGPPLHVLASEGLEYGATLDPTGSPVGLKTPASPLYVPGCALMTRAALFDDLEGFDERFFMFVEDADYCWRTLLSGFDVRVANCDCVRHVGGAVTPGGYLTRRGVVSTRFRVGLRERNTLAMLLKCYTWPLATIIVPLYVLQTLATAVALASVGRYATAMDILAALWWNARQLPKTRALRCRVQSSRCVSDREIIDRMYHGLWKLTLLKRFGLPQVSEDGPPPTHFKA